jgi:hypothetical protein
MKSVLATTSQELSKAFGAHRVEIKIGVDAGTEGLITDNGNKGGEEASE